MLMVSFLSFLSIAPKSVAPSLTCSDKPTPYPYLCYFMLLLPQIQHLSTWTQFLSLQIVPCSDFLTLIHGSITLILILT